ncbi:ACP S-malonyltransferase [Salinivibrio kushneri]|uniref:Malonyl CoA-acyl carrier protein transacylase n=1 Tax=Salinivibrio kushneri TaxID=1908198 RepID=A0AA47KIW9_9GAMM|nr:ACP S-malonyltransferase [Salinivibrio kushneri]WBA07820.1 ACP S-malonyltransferase [Salinivibrio kushneri]
MSSTASSSTATSPTAIVFPGQGSQAVGMLGELAEQYGVVQQTFSEASEVLGYDLWALVQQGPEADLNETHRTQPALLAASVAIWRVWEAQGGAAPAMLAGHSLGEYSALVCAGVLDFKAAIKLVELRGRLMQEAVPAGIGAMSAIIGLDNEAIATACEQAAQGQVVSPVNFNSPGQVVIAGNKEAVERANALCKDAGAKRALPLPVSVPSHCALMKPAAEKLAQALESVTFNTPRIPVVNNADVATPIEPAQIKEALVRQLHSPVRWTETVEHMAAEGVEQLLEFGPGKVLTGLTKRINKALSSAAVNDSASLAAAKA